MAKIRNLDELLAMSNGMVRRGKDGDETWGNAFDRRLEDIKRVQRRSAQMIANLKRSLAIITISLALIALPKNHVEANEPALWKALQTEGHVALLRHAIAPGTGDPEAFTIGDCSTQRNLSEEGRAQAARIGDRFRTNGIETARVFSSQWCRCRETAELLELGPVNELPALNSFYQRPENRKPHTEALREWLEKQDLSSVHVLVTHQVNITALTGVFPSSGELVIVRAPGNGDITVIGTIETD